MQAFPKMDTCDTKFNIVDMFHHPPLSLEEGKKGKING